MIELFYVSLHLMNWRLRSDVCPVFHVNMMPPDNLPPSSMPQGTHVYPLQIWSPITCYICHTTVWINKYILLTIQGKICLIHFYRWPCARLYNSQCIKQELLYPTINTMAADDLAMEGARASAAMVLTLFSWDIQVSILKGLNYSLSPSKSLLRWCKTFLCFPVLHELKTPIRYQPALHVNRTTSDNPPAIRDATRHSLPLCKYGHQSHNISYANKLRWIIPHMSCSFFIEGLGPSLYMCVFSKVPVKFSKGYPQKHIWVVHEYFSISLILNPNLFVHAA